MLIAMLWTILSLNQGVARVSCEPELSKLESGGTWEIQVPYPLGASECEGLEAAESGWDHRATPGQAAPVRAALGQVVQ